MGTVSLEKLTCLKDSSPSSSSNLTVDGLSLYFFDISFCENLECLPVWAASASTSFISTIHWVMASAVKNPIC